MTQSVVINKYSLYSEMLIVSEGRISDAVQDSKETAETVPNHSAKEFQKFHMTSFPQTNVCVCVWGVGGCGCELINVTNHM